MSEKFIEIKPLDGISTLRGKDRVRINNRRVFLRSFKTSSGCDVVNVVASGLSLSNAKDREQLKRLAEELRWMASVN